ncbi:putative membrane protein [Propionispora sp. 2/2-37]|uniref:hypothetical protein n=1 Tax=Propionispora sp. 2/2-37 TaxID=1677858 RepID=UPI0006BB7FF1|nr:hypothetical protein [Propionispora sp. 2/2-37]CUH95875.1 putative membrane protein [Propionispora sp. 2/2-37]
MANEKVEALKNSIKASNPNFRDGKLVSDSAFKQIVNCVQPTEINFGCRINNVGLLIGTVDKLLFVEKVTIGSTMPDKTLYYNDIINISIAPKFICNKITIVSGRLETIIEVDKTESDYIVNQIRQRIQKPNIERETAVPFVSNVNLKGIKLEILSQNFENDFKLVSTQKELYFQRSTKQGNEKIQILGNIKDVTQLTEENKQSLLKKAGWGFIGSVVAGPIGMFAGLLAKGNKKEISFICELHTGEKFLAKTDNETFQKLLSISL